MLRLLKKINVVTITFPVIGFLYGRNAKHPPQVMPSQREIAEQKLKESIVAIGFIGNDRELFVSSSFYYATRDWKCCTFFFETQKLQSIHHVRTAVLLLDWLVTGDWSCFSHQKYFHVSIDVGRIYYKPKIAKLQ